MKGCWQIKSWGIVPATDRQSSQFFRIDALGLRPTLTLKINMTGEIENNISIFLYFRARRLFFFAEFEDTKLRNCQVIWTWVPQAKFFSVIPGTFYTNLKLPVHDVLACRDSQDMKYSFQENIWILTDLAAYA